MLVALLLLLPDIGEISVSNLFTLKRRIDAQESEIRSTIDRQEVFQRQVLTHISSVANNQQVTQNFYQPLSQSAAELPKAIRAKESPDERLRNGSQSGINDEFKSSRIKLDDEFYLTDYGPDDAVRALRLIDEWEYFSFYIDPPLPYRTVVTTRESVSGEIRSAIWSKYRDEIDVVRSVRNSIAHARYVPPEDLRGALEAVQELNRILRVPTHELLGVSPEEFERRIREG